jgi:hypothetical protein
MQIGLSNVLRPAALDADSRPESERKQVSRLAARPEVTSAAAGVVGRESAPGSAAPPPVMRVPPAHGQGAAAEVSARDVNGDGRTDAVVRDPKSGASAVLLADAYGRLGGSAIALDSPTAQDLERLAVTGPETGRRFLAADLDGDGTRELAVKDGNQWLSLGQMKGTAAPAVTEAERRFEWTLGELSWIVPAFAWLDDDGPGGDPGTPNPSQMAGFVQMLNGNVDPNPLKALDLNQSNLGGLVMMDSLGGAIGAFDPFSIGMRLYGAPIAPALAAAPSGTPAMPPAAPALRAAPHR